MKYDVGGEIYGTARKISKSVLKQSKPETSLEANDKPEPVLLQTNHEKAGFLEKCDNAGGNE